MKPLERPLRNYSLRFGSAVKVHIFRLRRKWKVKLRWTWKIFYGQVHTLLKVVIWKLDFFTFLTFRGLGLYSFLAECEKVSHLWPTPTLLLRCTPALTHPHFRRSYPTIDLGRITLKTYFSCQQLVPPSRHSAQTTLSLLQADLEITTFIIIVVIPNVKSVFVKNILNRKDNVWSGNAFLAVSVIFPEMAMVQRLLESKVSAVN